MLRLPLGTRNRFKQTLFHYAAKTVLLFVLVEIMFLTFCHEQKVWGVFHYSAHIDCSHCCFMEQLVRKPGRVLLAPAIVISTFLLVQILISQEIRILSKVANDNGKKVN